MRSIADRHGQQRPHVEHEDRDASGRRRLPPRLTVPSSLTATAAGAELVSTCRGRPRRTNAGSRRLPGRALPGRGLHQLRPDRHADRARPTADTGLAPSTTYRYQRRAPIDAVRQPQWLFRHRRGHHRHRSGQRRRAWSGPGTRSTRRPDTTTATPPATDNTGTLNGASLDDPGPLRQRLNFNGSRTARSRSRIRLRST